MSDLFPLGRIVATSGALEVLRTGEGMHFHSDVLAVELVLRHASGDWGEVDLHDQRANDRAVRDGDRVLSAFTVGGQTLWVITEADRSVTTILLPEEY